MSSLRNPRSLADWLQLDYFRRPRPLKALWKPVLLATLAVGVAAMVAIAALQKRVMPRLATAYQAGPLSSSHAMFNNDCATCHREAFRTWNRLWQFNDTIRAVSDETCRKCHLGDIDPVHHDTQIRNDNCVTCHREHHDRIPLNRVPDSYCTSCHANLSAAVKPDQVVQFHAEISDFAGHPSFKEREDGGTIQFNHAVHLRKGGVPTPVSRATGKKNCKELQCGSCHVSDEAGRLMKPIQYKEHCQECHPLIVGVTSRLATRAATDALDDFHKTPAPHQAPEVVRAALRDRLTLFIQQHPMFLQDGPKEDIPRPIPGARPAQPEVVSKEEYEWVGRQLIDAEKRLFQGQTGCAFCHTENKPAPGQLSSYAASSINKQWLPHSRFKHDSHRMLDCGQCHDRAFQSTVARDVLLPSIETCRKCHGTQPGASARSDCVECHAYHPADTKRKHHGGLTIEEALDSARRHRENE